MITGIVEEFMKSVELQSMQQLAAVRVAISVCESEDVQCMIGRFRKDIGKDSVVFSDGQWKRLCGKVRRKLDQIGVPELIVDIILEKIWHVSFEIFKWILFHVVDMDIDSSSTFCWTPHVNIDYEKTAEILTQNETLDIKKRFKLACFYCLELEVRSLWEMMSLSEKRSFFVRRNLKESALNPIVLYWTCYIQEVPIDYWGIKTLKHTQLFKDAVKNGYLSATKFFLGKLVIQIRSRVIENSFSICLYNLNTADYIMKSRYFPIAYFLVSKLRYDSIAINSITFQSPILRYFLEWPLQKHFMTVVNRMSHYIRERIFAQLVETILEKDLRGFKDYDFKKLFTEFWLRSPRIYRTYVNTETSIGFKMLFKFVKKHFGFVFEESSFALKAKFRATVFQWEISEDDPDFEKQDVEFFKFLIRERVTTKPSLDTFAHLYPLDRMEMSFYKVPLGELKYLMDGILGITPLQFPLNFESRKN